MAPAGMHTVAMAARRHSVPFVVLCGIYKLSTLFPHNPCERACVSAPAAAVFFFPMPLCSRTAPVRAPACALACAPAALACVWAGLTAPFPRNPWAPGPLSRGPALVPPPRSRQPSSSSLARPAPCHRPTAVNFNDFKDPADVLPLSSEAVALPRAARERALARMREEGDNSWRGGLPPGLPQLTVRAGGRAGGRAGLRASTAAAGAAGAAGAGSAPRSSAAVRPPLPAPLLGACSRPLGLPSPLLHRPRRSAPPTLRAAPSLPPSPDRALLLPHLLLPARPPTQVVNPSYDYVPPELISLFVTGARAGGGRAEQRTALSPQQGGWLGERMAIVRSRAARRGCGLRTGSAGGRPCARLRPDLPGHTLRLTSVHCCAPSLPPQTTATASCQATSTARWVAWWHCRRPGRAVPRAPGLLRRSCKLLPARTSRRRRPRPRAPHASTSRLRCACSSSAPLPALPRARSSPSSTTARTSSWTSASWTSTSAEAAAAGGALGSMRSAAAGGAAARACIHVRVCGACVSVSAALLALAACRGCVMHMRRSGDARAAATGICVGGRPGAPCGTPAGAALSSGTNGPSGACS